MKPSAGKIRDKKKGVAYTSYVERIYGVSSNSYDTDYIGNFVYVEGRLGMIYHPEGVIRPTPPTAENTTDYVYDYFVKDYLGNVRVVITEEDAAFEDKYLATMEEVHALIEEQNFDNIDDTRQELPAGYPIDASAEFNEHIARLSAANGTHIGPSIVLPVQRGDRVSLSTQYFYTEDASGQAYDNMGFLVNELLIALASASVGVAPISEAGLMAIASGDNGYYQALYNILSDNFDTSDVSRPHAYLVWMLYDHNMRPLPEGSGAARVQNPNDLQLILRDQVNISHTGYLHCGACPEPVEWVSNGSTVNVSFDNACSEHSRNILITTMQGKVRQINHYYPYGLSISGIDGESSKYLNKYTSKELQTGEFDPSLSTGLEMFDFHARFYDPQLGRWFTPDPAEQFHNPYLAMGNSPAVYVDPDGEFVFAPIIIGAMIGGTLNWAFNGAQFNAKGLGYFGVGALAGGLAAGIGAGVSSALVSNMGGSFAAGFAGTTAVSSTGFAAGAVTGAASGVTSGFITGTGNALVGGQNIGNALSNGLDQSWKQGLTGAGIGGIVGGIQASKQGRDFWTGATKDDIVVQITSDGRVIDKIATEQITYNPNNPDQIDATFYKNNRTILNDPNHPTINRTINSDGTFEFTAKLPKRLEISGRTLSDPNNVPFISQKGRNLSMTFLSEPNDIMLKGTRFHNRPINNIGDMFNRSTKLPSWQNRMDLPIREWWKPYN